MNFACPHCRQPLEADDSFAGGVVDCPVCGKSFAVARETPGRREGNGGRKRGRWLLLLLAVPVLALAGWWGAESWKKGGERFCEKGRAAQDRGDFAEMAECYRKAARRGNAEGQYNYGVCFEKGDGVRQSLAVAAKWYRKAAEQGYGFAQYNLGCCYIEGRGVERSAAEAAKWFEKAAERGIVQAKYNLGLQYLQGNGVPESAPEAARWFRQAAEQGYADAQYNLAVCFAQGTGVAWDPVEAAKWYQRAAAQGHVPALCALGW